MNNVNFLGEAMTIESQVAEYNEKAQGWSFGISNILGSVETIKEIKKGQLER